MEVWHEIEGFGGRYSISNLGNVFSILRPWKFLQGDETGGYKRVNLTNIHGTRKYRVHRLVAEAFLENNKDCEQVNHLNGNKLDNRAENLEWCTRQENITHALEKLGCWRGERNSHAILTASQVKRIRLIKQITPNIDNKSLAIMFGTSPGNIRVLLKGKSWASL